MVTGLHSARVDFRSARQRRQGTVLVGVMICLLVVTSLLASMTRSILRAQRSMQREIQLRQVEQLLDAGLRRATSQLRVGGSEYQSETWRPAESAFRHPDESAVVSITVQSPQKDASKLIRVKVEYPAGTKYSIQRTRWFAVNHPRSF